MFLLWVIHTTFITLIILLGPMIINGSGKLELLSPPNLKGTHDYNFSTNGKYASHTFSNHFTKSSQEMIYVENQKPLNEKTSITSKLSQLQEKPSTEFFK